ncbi:MAG TPA: hypothetical protein VHZ26_02675 [Caulobacteraceae bacterium]|jgi:hypothetical protein|nr:hypothetical protein [Caulobacteraceae bacterium]
MTIDFPSAPSDVDQRHLIVISTASPIACLEAVTGVLGPGGARLGGFSLKRVGSRFEAVLQLTGLDDAAAERLAALIAARPDAGSVRTEHQWVRP